MTGKIFLPFFAFLLGFAVVFCCQDSAVGGSQFTEDDMLSASGTRVVNGLGETVQLRGFNLGGWLLKTIYMSPISGVDDDTDVGTILESRFGSTVAGELQETFLNNYITSADFDAVAATGANSVRLPFWWRNFMDENGDLILNAQNEPDFSMLDRAVSECAARGMYVVLDLHGAPGSQSDGQHYSGLETENPTFFARDATGEANRATTLELWGAIAEHFADEPAVAGYDILNEPYWDGVITPSNRWWVWEFYDDAYNTIRAVDTNHLIIFENCGDFEELPAPDAIETWKESKWKNVAYSPHYYPNSADNEAAMIAAFKTRFSEDLETQQDYDVPIYVGETNYYDKFGAWEEAFETFEANDWSSSVWAYKSPCSAPTPWGAIYCGPTAWANLSSMSSAQIEAVFDNRSDEAMRINQPLAEMLTERFSTKAGLEAGLCLHYSLDSADKNGSTLIDSSVNKNNATVSGDTWVTSGVHEQALTYSNVTKACAVLDSTSYLPGEGDDFSVAFWAKLYDWDNNSFIAFSQTANDISYTIGFHTYDDGLIVKTDFGTTTAYGVDLSGLNNNEFAHFLIEFDDYYGVANIYVNGEAQEDTRVTSGWNFTDEGTAVLGGRMNSSVLEKQFVGAMDDFAIMMGHLDAKERERLINLGVYSVNFNKSNSYPGAATTETGLCLHYSLDTADKSGSTLIDSSVNGNDATLYGSTSGTTGVHDEALTFSNVTKACAELDSTFNLPGSGDDFTVAFWAKVSDWDEKSCIAFSQTANDIAYTIGFHTYDDGLIVKTDFGTTTVFGVDLSGLTDDTFNHFLIEFDDYYGVENIYVNGEAQSDAHTTSGWNFTDEGTAVLGGRMNSSVLERQFVGTMDDFAIMMGHLDTNERERLINLGVYSMNFNESNSRPSATTEAGIRLHYSLDTVDMSGSTLIDSSGNGNNATVYGVTSTGSGVHDEALTYSNVTKACAVVDSTFDLPGSGDDFTVAFWAKVSDWDEKSCIAFSQTANDIAYTIGFHTYDDGLIVKTDFGTTTVFGVDLSGLTDNEFAHFLIEFDAAGGISDIYLNGEAQSDAHTTSGWNFTYEGTTVLGGRVNGDGTTLEQQFIGTMDDFAIMTGHLDANERNRLINLGAYSINFNETNSHPSATTEASLCLHYSLDMVDITDEDSDPTFLDSSDNSIDATVESGGDTWSVGGVHGQALTFSGVVQDYACAELESTADLPGDGDDFTVAFWAKLSDWDDRSGIVFSQTANGISWTVGFHTTDDGLIVKTGFGTTTVFGVDLSELDDDEFAHFLIEFDDTGGVSDIYLNGEAQTDEHVTSGWNFTDEDTAVFGARMTSSVLEKQFVGTLDDFAIIMGHLTEGERERLMNLGVYSMSFAGEAAPVPEPSLYILLCGLSLLLTISKRSPDRGV